MKNIILSILGSILCTSFVIGLFIFFVTFHIELMAISGSIIMLVMFYLIIKNILDLESKGE